MLSWGDLTAFVTFLTACIGLAIILIKLFQTLNPPKPEKRPSAKKKRSSTRNSSKKRNGKRK